MSHHSIIEMSYDKIYEEVNKMSPTQHSHISSADTEIQSQTIVRNEKNQTHIYIMAGAAAGIMEHCVMYPVDSIKTRMQSLRPHPKASYRNMNHAVRKIIKTEGFLRPLRGINVVALGAGPSHALYFASYEMTKKALGNNGNGGHFPMANAVSGIVATFFHDGIMNPVEVVKQRLQMFGSPYRGVYDCAKTVLRTEGMGAFYRSFTTQLTMNAPFQCIHFVTYEFLRESLNPSGGYDPRTHLISGAVAGGLAAACTTPLDVAKTLLNTQEPVVCKLNDSPSKPFVRGMFTALKTIYRVRGFSGFFRGLHARVIYQVPSCALSWSVYEFFKYNLSLKITDEEMMELTV